MSFYTNVSKLGNSILYRGYNDYGEAITHKYKFQPTFYVPTREKTDWKALAIQASKNEAKSGSRDDRKAANRSQKSF